MLSIHTNIEAVLHKQLNKLNALKPGGQTLDRALSAGAGEILTLSRERIHARGQGADAAAIGAYDTKPAYISASSHPAPGEAIGRHGTSVFANGKPHRSRYLPGGYNEYKTLIGQNTGGVNLVLTGELRDSYQVIKTTEGYGLGWTDEELRSRADALEAKYGKKIWHPSDEERAVLKALIAQYVR